MLSAQLDSSNNFVVASTNGRRNFAARDFALCTHNLINRSAKMNAARQQTPVSTESATTTRNRF
jgi:hypothetical protein